MKKTLGILVLVLLMFSMTALAEEEGFIIHSGVEFGLSPSAVEKLETDHGFQIGEGLMPNTLALTETTIAGIEQARITYIFTEENLFQARYDLGSANAQFHSDKIEPMRLDYTKISEALTEKYGPTEYTWLTNKTYDFPGVYLENPTSGHGELEYYSAKVWWTGKIDVEKYEQWFIPMADGTGVFIDHCFSRTDFGGTDYAHVIRYTHVDAATVSNVLDKQNQRNNDL